MRLYESLCKIFSQINNINSITDLLKWDTQVMMPGRSIKDRVRQINTLSSIKHDILTNNTVTNLIQEGIKQRSKLNGWEQSDLMHMEKAHNNAKIQLKSKTSEEISKATMNLGMPKDFKWPI